MYYDKSVFSEEDIKNLDSMLEKGTVAFPLTNSWYTPEYGKIRVEAEVLGMFVRFSVSDTGIGIAPEHRCV